LYGKVALTDPDILPIKSESIDQKQTMIKAFISVF